MTYSRPSVTPLSSKLIDELVVEACLNLKDTSPFKILSKVNGQTSIKESLEVAINVASGLIAEEPQYIVVASKLLNNIIRDSVRSNWIFTFSDSIEANFKLGLLSEETKEKVQSYGDKLEKLIDHSRDDLIPFFGLKVLQDRYLLKNGVDSSLTETVQYMWMRVACGLGDSFKEIKELYEVISQLEYVPSTPTLFNSGLVRDQMSSCYLLDSPEDSLESIYERYGEIAKLSKYAGGIGVSFSKVRSRGSLIKGTNGPSSGIIPFIKTLDSSVSAVNQGGKRKGAAAVYLEPWHNDIEEFLELRYATGDQTKRTHNLNTAVWIPDLFMSRVDQDSNWSLFDPKEVPELANTYGGEFEKIYLQAEQDLRYTKQVSARDLYTKIMKSLGETGNAWVTFKDSSNRKSNQTLGGKVIHCSNLCTEILEVTDNDSIAVCNLGSINLSRLVFTQDGKKYFNYEKLASIASKSIKYLDKVIDKNFYPVDKSGASNRYWRPVGLGIMGWQDVLFKMRIPFESEEAVRLAEAIQEVIYFNAIESSWQLAKENGPFQGFSESRTSLGFFQYDFWGVEPKLYPKERWSNLREKVRKDGIRNSLLIAIAPTATIASISGCYETIEPQLSNIFKRESLSGEFLQINSYLVEELKNLNLWNSSIRQKIKNNEGSIQSIQEIPEFLRKIYKTAWEISQKSLIEIAVARGAYIDQSQSLSFFMAAPNIDSLSSMYMYAWKRGLKTTYYLRSRPASNIAKTYSQQPEFITIREDILSPEEAARIACSLENPEDCEACQ